MRQAASRKAGGQGIRYVCEVEGSIAVLFHDEPYWFIEREESVESLTKSANRRVAGTMCLSGVWGCPNQQSAGFASGRTG